MKIGKIATDEQLEVAKWVEIEEGFAIQVKWLGNKEYANYCLELGEENRARLRSRSLKTQRKQGEEITNKAMARYVLVGWRGLHDECPDDCEKCSGAGCEIPYSEAKALELLTTSPEFYRWVEDASSAFATFREKDSQDSAKNLPSA